MDILCRNTKILMRKSCYYYSVSCSLLSKYYKGDFSEYCQNICPIYKPIYDTGEGSMDEKTKKAMNEDPEYRECNVDQCKRDNTPSDPVNHPSHYISKSGIEVIDVIEAFTSDLNAFDGYCTGNIIKYICRWKHKNGLEDLKKARWYLNRLIAQVESESQDGHSR